MNLKILALVGSAFLLSACSPAAAPTPTTTPAMESVSPSPVTPTEPASPSAKMKGYTLTDIATHKTKEDCWMAIEGKVYDVTPVTSSGKHPGGEVIMTGCGTDATKLFNARPGKGTPHSAMTKSNLVNFEIGVLQ